MGRLARLALVGVLLGANAGCLVVAAGAAAAGGAAAGYAYLSAPVYREFPLAVPDAATATRAALADLQFPLVKEEQTAEGPRIESLSGDKQKILIQLSARPVKVPADGAVTRISIRVATWGDERTSGRILDQIQIRVPAPVVQAPPPPAPTPGRIQPAAFQSPEPPPASPVPVAPASVTPQPIP